MNTNTSMISCFIGTWRIPNTVSTTLKTRQFVRHPKIAKSSTMAPNPSAMVPSSLPTVRVCVRDVIQPKNPKTYISIENIFAYPAANNPSINPKIFLKIILWRICIVSNPASTKNLKLYPWKRKQIILVQIIFIYFLCAFFFHFKITHISSLFFLNLKTLKMGFKFRVSSVFIFIFVILINFLNNNNKYF